MAEKEASIWSTVRQALADTALTIAGLACLGLGVVTLWRGESVAAGTGLTAGLMLLLAATIDRFEVLKGLGVEARIKKLDGAIDQATATLEQLRDLSEITGESLVLLNARVGNWDISPPPEQAYEVVQRVKQNLENVGSTDAAIKKAMSPWVSVTTCALVSSLIAAIRQPWELLLQDHNEALQKHPTPGDSSFQALIEKRNHLGSFEANYIGGDVRDWAPGTHSKRLREIVSKIPLRSEEDRKQLTELIAPWLPRLDYLAANYDLSDKDEWFTKLEKWRTTGTY